MPSCHRHVHAGISAQTKRDTQQLSRRTNKPLQLGTPNHSVIGKIAWPGRYLHAHTHVSMSMPIPPQVRVSCLRVHTLIEEHSSSVYGRTLLNRHHLSLRLRVECKCMTYKKHRILTNRGPCGLLLSKINQRFRHLRAGTKSTLK